MCYRSTVSFPTATHFLPFQRRLQGVTPKKPNNTIIMITPSFLIRRLTLLLPLVTMLQVLADPSDQLTLFSDYGVNKSPENAATYKKAGATMITVHTSSFLVPDKANEEYTKILEKAKGSVLPIFASNSFIRPKHLRCVGPEANHDEVLVWAETVFRRIQQAGGKMVIFGSGGSRRLPKGWPVEKANTQFVALLIKMAPIAQKYGVTVALEQLNSKECNYINRISEAAAILRAVDHPNVRLLADLYHMVSDGDTPEDLKKAVDLVVHVEIAEKKGRTFPGVNGDDFRPFFRVLRDAGYRAGVSIEGRGSDAQLAPAIAEIKKQAADVMAEKR